MLGRGITLGMAIAMFLAAPLSSGAALTMASDEGVQWKPLGGPPGVVYALAVDPRQPNTLFAGTYGDIYKSTGGGATWSPASRGLPRSNPVYPIVVDPQAPATVYAATRYPDKGYLEGALYKSTNGGSTWLPLQVRPRPGDRPTIWALAVHPRDSQTLYALTDSGKLLKTSDGGSTWARLELAESNWGTGTLIDPLRPDNIYVAIGLAGDSFFYKSADGGASWSRAGGQGLKGFVRSVALDPGNPRVLYAGTNRSGVYKSIDGGETWSQADAGLPSGLVLQLEVDPGDSSQVYAVVQDPLGGELSGDVYKSTDGGQSWALSGPGLPESGVKVLTLDPLAPATLYAGTVKGVYKSTNGGTSWAPASAGLGGSLVKRVVADPSQPGRLYILLYDDRIFRTTDGGRTWEAQMQGLEQRAIAALALDPSRPGVLYALAYPGDQLFKSTDGGTSWMLVGGWIASGMPPQVLLVDQQDPRILYAGVSQPMRGNGIYKSTDGGVTWSALWGSPTTSEGPEVFSLAMDPKDCQVLYAATYRGVYKTTDGGATWQPPGRGWPSSRGEPTPAYGLAVDPLQPSVVYAATLSGVYKSTDGGATWAGSSRGLPASEEGPNPVGLLAMDPLRPHVLYAAAAGAIYRSLNGGDWWEAMPMGELAERGVTSLAVDPFTGLVYAGTQGAGLFYYQAESPAVPPQVPVGPPGKVDAMIEIVWPHGGQWEADKANVTAYLFLAGSLGPPPCGWEPTVRLWASLNNGPARFVKLGQKRMETQRGKVFPVWDFNDVDVSQVKDWRNRLYFYITADGVEGRSNVWAHGRDPRTNFPRQDRPTGVGPIEEADVKIEIVWPQGGLPVSAAPLVNVTAMVFQKGTLRSASPDFEAPLRLFRSLDNGMLEPVKAGVKRLEVTEGLTYPVWDFNDVGVTFKARWSKYYFLALAEGMPSYPSIWGHGDDPLTYFPQKDEPARSCQ